MCDGVQGMVDGLRDDASPVAAMVAVNDLQKQVVETDNPDLERAGRQFFEAILPTVSDVTDAESYGELTLDESQKLAAAVFASADIGITGLLNTCIEVGAPVTGLPDRPRS